jgi:cysteine desulfurase family protein
MIYLDSAATTLQKPKAVGNTMLHAVHTLASPGRGGHRPAMQAADAALECRLAVCGLFGMENPEQVIFTFNATHSLNIAISSLVAPGDRVVISGYEHNAVVRPLHALGADVRIAASPLFEPEAAVQAFQRELPFAKVAICNHVSNVFGYILPLEEISRLCRNYGVPLIVDASQSAGTIDINFDAIGAEYIAMPGHKGLLGPQGTGLLLCRDSAKPLLYGGTGSSSASPDMPAFLPDRLEAGTHNMPGIVGLMSGIQFVQQKTPAVILAHEQKLTSMMAERLSQIPGLTVYHSPNTKFQAGVLSVTTGRANCEAIAESLGKHGIAVRSGLHCSPCAHETVGTLEVGTVRYSFSPFNTQAEVIKASALTKEILKKL